MGDSRYVIIDWLQIITLGNEWSKDKGGTKRKSDTKVKEKTQQPRKFKVVLHNDDFTPMEFVLLVLGAYLLSKAQSTKEL